MVAFTDRIFRDQTVRLDGNEYSGCIFEGCTLEYAANETVALANCSFRDCRFVFVGPAALTLNFLSGVYAGMGEEGGETVEEIFDFIRAGQINLGQSQDHPQE